MSRVPKGGMPLGPRQRRVVDALLAGAQLRPFGRDGNWFLDAAPRGTSSEPVDAAVVARLRKLGVLEEVIDGPGPRLVLRCMECARNHVAQGCENCRPVVDDDPDQ